MTEGRLSILHVAVPAPAGGLERVLHSLAAGQHAQGHRVRVLAVVDPGQEDHPFAKALRERGVSVDTLAIPSRAYLAERRRVAELLRAEPTDILHTHGYRPDVLDSQVGRRMGVPTVTTEHGMSKMGGRTAIYEWLQNRALRRFDAVVAVSAKIARELPPLGVAEDRIHLIPNAWGDDVRFLSREEARKELALSPDAFAVGWIGRLIGAKGGDVFLDALARLPQDLEVVIIGDGPERQALEAQAASRGLADRVRFLGLKEDAARLMRAFDVFPLSSRTEGTPIVLLEAMAAEVPVVATRVGGVPDVVGPAEALLVASEDPAALAEAIDQTRRDPAAATTRARAARARLSAHYGLERWITRYGEVYRGVLRGGRRH